ncbi:MAG: hypothetical protein JHD15_10515 [Phenylobacterium sp.]|jgi:hypothetical protein|uniref:DUF6249 domain-containing protein n=1 Tax=unclassified Phenylobacterium TaxID=2640670 RepID=UPI0008C741E5|nr:MULTISPECIES: DUF6249 domain-containing protein [unclassified Phenylobacterium]MBJ7410776.1 hypothetical protein [Phenylobacterium sp.]OHB28409.1 MAG: hypothetical protein A2790_15420 [Phenylobacterium sp. RIFCSPHIGHO2_01_FULL_69_31]
MEILIPLGFFAMIAALVIAPRYFKSQERQKVAETLRIAIEKGQPLPPEVIDAMSSNVRSPGLTPSPQRDLRTGIIWLGVGVGFAALGAVISFEEPDALFPCLGLATFPTFIGLAFIALGLLNKSKS